MLKSRKRKAARTGFWRREDASLTVEAVFIFPLVLWAFVATITFVNVFQTRALAQKGNYAVADLLSRETNAINQSYLNGIGEVYEYLTKSDTSAWIRVTPVRCQRRCNNMETRLLKRDWSRATDGIPRLTNAEVDANYRDIIPEIPKGERVIMVETQMNYAPPFSSAFTILSTRTLQDISMTRPRFAPQLCWVGRRCGNT
ncbi:MAG TPA: hypothetical protein ENK28_10830 [Aliiroseovarius sp.]|nr:hypothetical protein [Aliiroseovarius sp.]